MDYNALEQMTVVKLREEAKKADISGTTGMKKEELIEALAEKLGLEKPVRTKRKKSKSAPLGKAALKQRLAELREQRKQARSAANRKQVQLLRRRIHSTKRRLRRAV